MKQLIIALFTILFFTPPIYAAGFGTVSGRIIMPPDVSHIGGIIMLYKKNTSPPFSPQKYRLMPEPVDFFKRDGQLLMKYIPPGQYYLEIAVRTKVEAVGPPGPGDYSYLHTDSKGDPVTISVLQGQELLLDDIHKVTRYKTMLDKKNLTGIEGIILNNDGEPMSFCVVFAYTSPEMKGEPYVLSEQSNTQGRYLLGLPKAGDYYLAAYDMAKGAPILLGNHGGHVPVAVTVENGQIVSGIDF